MRGRQTLVALETAWRRDPQAVFVRLGEALREDGAPDRSVTVLRDGLSRWPHQLAAWVALARTLLSLGQSDEAVSALGEALARDPEHWGANLLLAEVHRSRGALGEEVAVLRRLARGAPGQEGLARLLRIAEAAASHRPAMPGPSPQLGDVTTAPMPSARVRPGARAAPFRVQTMPSATRPLAPGRRSTVPAASFPSPPAAPPRRVGPLSGPGGKHRAAAPADPFLNETMADLLAAQGLSAEARRVLLTLAERRSSTAGLEERLVALGTENEDSMRPSDPPSLLAELLLAVASDLDAIAGARRTVPPSESS